MTYVLNKSLKKTKSLSYIHQGAFVIYVEELQHCSCNGALKCGGYSVRYAGLGKV